MSKPLIDVIVIAVPSAWPLTLRRFSVQRNQEQKVRLQVEQLEDRLTPGVLTVQPAADVTANTERFNRVIEQYVRRYPEQWLWVHRRWKTRPEGEPPVY